MALTTAQQVRLRINDPWRRGNEVQYGDGTASSFQLLQGAPYSTIVSATASVMTTAGWTATGSTIDTALGYVELSARPTANSPIRFDYLWAVFSDAEISQFTADGGNVLGGAMYGVKALMADAARRNRWAAPDGTSVDDTKVLDNLDKLYGRLLDELNGEGAAPEGGYTSWAENQQDYS